MNKALRKGCPSAWRFSSRIAALARRPSGRFADFSEIGVHTCLCLKLVGGKGQRSVIIIGSIVATLTTVRRAEFSRLQNEVKQLSMMQNEVKRLSKKITALEVDEERRFLMELNKPKRWRTALLSDSLRPRPPPLADRCT